MNLLLQRDTFTDKSTIGKLYVNGEYFSYTLEDTMRERGGAFFPGCKVQNETAIPVGVYKVVIDFSPHFHKELPHLLNVPYYEGVRIHPGNYAGHETFYKEIPINTQMGVLYSDEYVEVFDD